MYLYLKNVTFSSVFVLLMLAASCASAGAQEIIANSSVPEAVLSESTLQAIFGMRLRQWPDGTPILVYTLPDDSPLHVTFSRNVLHIFPHQLRRAWDRLVFSGTGQAPIEVNSEEEMRRKVATTPGAIGYVSKASGTGGIHVLPVR